MVVCSIARYYIKKEKREQLDTTGPDEKLQLYRKHGFSPAYLDLQFIL